MPQIICMIFTAGILVLSHSVHALESWVGSRTLYSATSKNEYGIQVHIEASGDKGLLVLNSGHADVTVAQEKGSILLTLQSEVSYLSYPYKRIEETGEVRQVTQVLKLEALRIEGSEYNTQVIEFWVGCYQYLVDNAQKEVCENQTPLYIPGLVVEEDVTSIGFQLKAGDNIVLPLPNQTRAFVRLNGDNSVETLTGALLPEQPKVSRWYIFGEKLLIIFSDNSIIAYARTREMEGISRIVGLYRGHNTLKILVGPFAVDEKIETSSYTDENFAGRYKTVLAGTQREGFLYEFDRDGLGGFDTHFANSTTRTDWLWSSEDGLMVAKIYRFKKGSRELVGKEDLSICIDDPSQCQLFQKRSYKIIGQQGNRYTMLRTLEKYAYHQNEQQTQRRLSVWTFYKQ